MSAFLDNFADFLLASPSSYHAAAECARQLRAQGWVETNFAELADGPEAMPHRGFLLRDGAIVAWSQPAGLAPTAPYRVIGTHTDSPGFVVKPAATSSHFGYLQVGVEVYGGPLLNSWLDRELELAGRLVTRDGEVLVRSGAALRIPQLAIHLDREVNAGLTLDKQRHTQPIWGMDARSQTAAAAADIVGTLAETAGLSVDEVIGYDLITVDSQGPARFGREREFLASARLDNLSSTYAALAALLASGATHAASPDAASATQVLVAFNHEEIGSETRAGACGPLLEDVLAALGDARRASPAEQRAALDVSWLVSGDAGHGIHPNYPEKHDPANQPVLGGGPLLKINANQRYATDGHGAALWADCCERAGVPWQAFVSNNSVPCGSTIGPLSATRLGITTVDVGVPLLSMHSARELCHVDDTPALSAAFTAFYGG